MTAGFYLRDVVNLSMTSTFHFFTEYQLLAITMVTTYIHSVFRVRVMVFNFTFNNISVILWG